MATGGLAGGVKIVVVRYGATYVATNRRTLPAAEVRQGYRSRAQIAAVLRVCTDQRGWSGCQARSERAQLHHMRCCLVAFCVLERACHMRGLSSYKLKRRLRCQGRTVVLPALEQLRQTA